MRRTLPVATAEQTRANARVLGRRHPRQLSRALVLHCLAAVAGLAGPRLLGGLVQGVQQGTTTTHVDEVALLLAAFVLAQTVFTRYARRASSVLGERVLADLREEYRTVFVLFHEQGQPYEEIALALERPVGTIKTWLHRARLEILERLRSRGMVPPEELDPALNDPLTERRGPRP